MATTTASEGTPSVSATGPGALIRTLDGRITYWSPEMAHRYGYAPDEAVGQVAHSLLRTVSWQTMDAIELALVNRTTWRGGLLHYRADDQPVIVANHWHLHQSEDRTPLVTELHSDIVAPGSTAGGDLADVLTAMTHQLSEPLMAIGGYVTAAQRDLRSAGPHKTAANEAIDRAIRQLARARETLNRMRALGARLRDGREVEVHARLTATMEQTARTMQATAAAAVAWRSGESGASAVRSGARSLEHIIALQNIQLFQRLLRQAGIDQLEPRAREVVAQLLRDEGAKLTALER